MNTYGELGNGTTIDAHAPTPVAGVNATWTSSDTSIATIDVTGLATSVSPGTTTITAVFNGRSGTSTLVVLGRPTLSVARDGEGIVTSNVPGINCGTSCSAAYDANTMVTLTATAINGFSFVGWNGCDSASSTACTVTMNAARSIGATFGRPTLALQKLGNGRGHVLSSEPGIDCGPATSACMSTFDTGTALTLAASPSEGSLLGGWSGCDSVDGNFCQVTMNASKSITTSFTLQRFVLTVEKPGVGQGTVTSSPEGIACGSACAASYDYGTTVTLTATPALGSLFVGWTGCDAVSGATCVVAIKDARSIAANFVGVPLP
jgi:hypothetical protein